MPYYATVMYKKNPESTFDMDYYIATHMPLVYDSWKDHGLKAWTVKQFDKGPDGSEPPFMVQADLDWESQEAMGKALQLEVAKKIFGDVTNFTNEQPLFLVAAHKGAAGSRP